MSENFIDKELKLIKDTAYRDGSVCLNKFDCEWYAYCEGYFYAANILLASSLVPDFINPKYTKTENFMEENPFVAHITYSAYPIFFLYRHYVEIKMKYLIHESQKLLIQELDSFKKHSLNSLYEKLIALNKEIDSSEFFGNCGLKECGNDKVVEGLENLKGIIEELNKLDKNSTLFRYPYNQNNEKVIDDNMNIDLPHFYEVMQKVHKLFTTYDYKLDYLQEMYSDYHQEICGDYYNDYWNKDY